MTTPSNDDIGAIAYAEVTRGCNPPANTLYCPDDFVTREQMAAFMNRLGNLDGESTPSVDAASLGGFSADQLIRVAYAADDDDALVGTDGDVLSTSIEAPVDGFLVISASSDVVDSTALDILICSIEVDGTDVHSSLRFLRLDGDTGVNEEEDCSTDAVVPVQPGTHAVDFEANGVGAGTTFDTSVLSVLFVPFDGEGNPPSDFTIVGDPAAASEGN